MMISLYAHGMSVRVVSRITGHVLDEVKAWQPRPLDPACEVAFPGAIVVKVRGPALAGRPAHQEW